MHPITGCVCSICGERILSPYAVSGIDEEPRCGLCRRIQPPFAKAVAYGSYEGGLRELIHLLKYGGIPRAASVLGRMLADAIEDLESDFPQGTVAVVAVPLHRAKHGQRGFNQAELIARAALKLQPSPGRLRLLEGVLERKRDTRSQTGLTSHQRRENMRGAFMIARPEEVKGRPVLVVDDVYTTGTTVSECARILRRAGASKVWVATVARTLKTSAREAQITPRDEGDEEAVLLAQAAGG